MPDVTNWVGDLVDLLVPKGNKQTICNELDVLVHQRRVHANESNGQCVYNQQRDEYTVSVQEDITDRSKMSARWQPPL